MVFSSLTFLFRFLPLFLACYYIFPAKYRNICLFMGSILFYAFGEPVYVLLILSSLIFNYAMANLMDFSLNRPLLRHFLFFFCVIVNFGILVFFKYTGFFLENINALHILISGKPKPFIPVLKAGIPLGISFYTFQILSYIIDVYRNSYRCERNFLHLGVYLCMFPQLIAGPIITYPEISDEIHKRTYSRNQLEYGLQLFIMGLGSKVILANRIGTLWHSLQTIGYDSLTMPLAWLGAFAYSFQLYFDFYGYSLMAVGLGKMLGFTIPKNFDHPYLSLSFTEFFRKWHISLGKWFREYVYIPLGGNRKGKGRTIFNLFFVWFFTGIWHGASWNFIVWGISVCLFIVAEKMFLGKYLAKCRPLAALYMILLLPLSWMLFAAGDLVDVCVYISKMFSFSLQNNFLGISDFVFYLKSYGILLLCCVLCITYLPDRLFHQFRKKKSGILSILLIFWISVYFLANSLNDPFLYFRF